jgi:hypothetical protein
MANEIDLYKDLELCDRALKATKGDEPSQREWRKERAKIVAEIKERYPDLDLDANE